MKNVFKKLLILSVTLFTTSALAAAPTVINLTSKKPKESTSDRAMPMPKGAKGIPVPVAAKADAPAFQEMIVVGESPLEKKQLLYYPDMPLALGRVYAGQDLFAQKRDCFQASDEKPIRKNNAVQSTLSMEVITSREDLLKSLGVSASLAGQMKLIKRGVEAKASLDWVDTQTFSNDTLTLLVKVDSSYGIYERSDYVLKKDYLDSVRAKDFNYFKNQCGDMFVISESRRAVVAVVFTVRNVNKAEKDVIAGALQGGLSWGVGEASVDTKVNKVVAQASQQGRISMNFYSSAGSGMGDLQSMIQHVNGGLDGIVKSLGDFVSKIDKNFVPPSILFVSPLEMAFPRALSKIKIPRNYRVVPDEYWEKLYFQHSAVKATLFRIDDQLSNTSLPADWANYYTIKRVAYIKRKAVLESVAEELDNFTKQVTDTIKTVIPEDLVPVVWRTTSI